MQIEVTLLTRNHAITREKKRGGGGGGEKPKVPNGSACLVVIHNTLAPLPCVMDEGPWNPSLHGICYKCLRGEGKRKGNQWIPNGGSTFG